MSRPRHPLAALAVATTLTVVVGCSDDPADLSAPIEGDTVGEVPVYDVEVQAELPHDSSTFTQGLVLDAEGAMFESGGLAGGSKIQEVDPTTGEVVRAQPVPEVFAEGLGYDGERLVQITWTEEEAYAYDPDTFELLETYTYDGEGWGLCHDGEQWAMSDGSAQLTFRDTSTFEETGTVDVTLDGAAVEELNELECAKGRVYANIWKSDRIVEIDPSNGEVTAVIEAGGLLDPAPGGEAVLNGIAYDEASDTFWLTGKLWPTLFRVQFVERGSATAAD